MGLVLDLLARSRGTGKLVLGSAGRERLRGLEPTFERVSRETAAHPRGPIPAAFFAAIAWGESGFRPKVLGPALPGGDVAVGLTQVLRSHNGRRVTWGGPGDVTTIAGAQLTDPLANLRAAAGLLFDDFDYGDDVRATLKKYGGFVRADPTEYIQNVESRYFWLLARRTLTGSMAG